MACSSPRVTATAERSGSGPVAKAFGARSSTTYTAGVGSPAAMASPSTMLCSRGSSSWVTGRALEVRRISRWPYR